MFHVKLFASFGVRIPSWDAAMRFLSTNWFAGVGLGRMPWVLEGGAKADQVMHSSLIQNITALGVLLIPIVVYMVRKFKWAICNPVNQSIIIIMILSLVEYPLEIKRLWIPLMFIFANYIKENR
jgi:hypothetical protein